MDSTIDDTSGLIEKARRGDRLAEGAILQGHRQRLRRLIASRLDRRLRARVDPSDVLQEAMTDASRRLPAYLQNPPLPLVAWLSQFVLERLAKVHRQHLLTDKRSVAREQRAPAREDLVAGGTSPSGRAIRDEECQQVHAAMARLPFGDRKILAMRHIEAPTMAEIASSFGIKEGAAKVRHLRALRRLQALLEEPR